MPSCVEEPVVERPVVLELQRADRVRDALDRVRLAVREVVHRVDAPRVARAVVRGLADPVQRGSRRLMFGEAMSIFARSTRAPSANSPARMRAKRSRFSSTERSRYGLSRPGSVSVPRCSRISSARQVVDVGLALPDQLHGPVVELLEVVRGVVEVLAPVEAEPAHVALDRVDVLDVLLGRVGVVEAQVAARRRSSRGEAEVEADRLGVADVQVAVRLGREARDHATAESPARRGPRRSSCSMKFEPAASLVAIAGSRAHIVVAARRGRKGSAG